VRAKKWQIGNGAAEKPPDDPNVKAMRFHAMRFGNASRDSALRPGPGKLTDAVANSSRLFNSSAGLRNA
jgi:hypothetical protein